jgi:anaerobic ribonucleoside-triphosphate reductase
MGMLSLGKKIEDFCIECGETTEFSYDGEQWVCQKCGSHNSQGDFEDSIPTLSDDDLERGK